MLNDSPENQGNTTTQDSPNQSSFGVTYGSVPIADLPGVPSPERDLTVEEETERYKKLYSLRTRYGKKFFITISVILVLMLLLIGTVLLLSKKGASPRGSNSQTLSSDGLSLADSRLDGTGTIDPSRKLEVNSKLIANNSIVLAPTNQPTAPQVGQIFLNKSDSKLYFYNGIRFVEIASASTASAVGLQGPAGANGIQGPRGLDGINGAKGDKGDQGDTGAQGPQGPAGVGSCPYGDCVSLQVSSPGTQEVGNLNVSGVIIAGSFSGNGSSLTSVNAATLNGQAGSYYTNATNLTSGTVSDARLSPNVTLQGNTFNGMSQLVQTTAGGALPVISGANLTSLNATNISSGTLSDARLSTNVTVQGNTFNGVNQLVQLNGSGFLPALNGSLLTNVDAATLNGQAGSYYTNASNISSGTLSDSRLSSNVTLQGNTFNGASQLVQLNGSTQLPAVSGALLTNLNGSSISSGTVSNTYLTGSGALTVTAGNGLINGGSVSLGGSTTLNIGAGDGITVNADDIAVDSTVCRTSNNCTAVGAAAGDLTGSYPNPTIASLQGKTLTVSATPTTGGVLQYNGSAFVDGLLTNTNLTVGTYSSITGTGALTAGSIGGSFGNINIGSNTFTGNGSGLTNLNASNISSGTLNDSRLSVNVTTQGNTFNGISQLVQTNGSGYLPALNGSLLTNVDAATLNGQAGSYYTNATNISSGTLNDLRLSSNVTLQGNTFNGASQLVQTTVGGALPTLSGINLTNLNASSVASGTLSDARLSSNVTLQGNTFNGISQLVQLNGSGYLPALNASLLTNLNASNIASGTLNDARLSANVTVQGNTFNGVNQLVQLDGSGYLPALNGAALTNLNGSNIASGTVNNTYLTGSGALTVTAGAGLTNGGSVALGGSTTLNIGAGDGITVNANDVAVDSTVCRTSNNCTATGAAGGDLTGSYPNPTIASLQGKTLTVSGTPTTGAVLQYNGSAFVDGLIANGNLAAGTFTNITGVGALTAGSIGGSFGNINIGSNTFTGNGSGLTNVDAATLGGQVGSYYTNASNISSGTLNDLRLSSNVTLQGNTFNGASQLVQTTVGGALPTLSGINLTNLNASNIASGTLNDLRLSSNVTLQGNTFNGISQLVQLDGSGYLPALNASLLTAINASNISSGTLNDSRLSTNVALLNQANTFTALLTANAGITLLTGQNLTINGDVISDLTGTGLTVSGGALTVDATSSTGFIRNGGNTFGAAATIGTNDANILNFETAGINRFQLSANASTLTGQGNTTLNSTGILLVEPASGSNLYLGTSNTSQVFITSNSVNLGAGNLVVTAGNTTIYSDTYSPTAFQVQDGDSTTVFNVNGLSGLVTVTNSLDVGSNLTVTGLLTANGNLTLQTGDTFTINGDALTDLTGSGLINSGGALTVDTTSSTGFFRNGGNSFGAAATLGTNDGNVLNLETNNTNRFQVSASSSTLTGQGATTLTSTGTLALTSANASNLNISSGTGGNININAGGQVDLSSAAGYSLYVTSGTNGILTLDSGTTGGVNLGTGAFAKTVTVGNTTGATTLNLQAGTGGASVNTTGNFNVTANDTTILSQNDSVMAFQVQSSLAAPLFNVDASTASTTVYSPYDSTTAFQVQNSTAGPLFNIDALTGSTTVYSPSSSATTLQVLNGSGDQLINVNAGNLANNLITNPSFEVDDSGWNGGGIVDTSYAYTGKNSLLYSGSSGSVSYDIALTSNTSYTLSFYARVTPYNYNGLGTMYAGHYDGTSSNNCMSNQTVSTSGWTRYTCTFTTGTTSGAPHIYIGHASANQQDLYIDGVQLLNNELASNDIAGTNSTFESGVGNWAGYSSGSITQSSTQALAGTYSGRIITSTNSDSGVALTGVLSLSPSTIYTVKAYIRLDASSPSATFSIGHVTDSGQTGTAYNGCNPVTPISSEWRVMTCTFKTASSLHFAPYITINQRSNTGTVITAYVDSISMYAGTDAAGTNQGFTIGGIDLNGAITSPVLFQNTSNSTTAFQIQGTNSSSSLLVADTLNNRLAVGKATADYTLDVEGTINSSISMITPVLTSAAGTALSIDSGTTGALNIGTGASAKTITIGNATGATSVVVNCGTGPCSFGANATAHTTTIGSLTGAAATTIQGGTGGVSLGSSGVANTIQIGNTTGAVSQTINIGNNSTASSTNNINIGSTVAGTTAIAGPTTITGRTSGSSSTLIVDNSTSTGSIFIARDNGTAVMTIANNGGTTFKTVSDTANAFKTTNSANEILLSVGTAHSLAENTNMIKNSSFEPNGSTTGWAAKNAGSMGASGGTGSITGAWVMSIGMDAVDEGTYYSVTLSPSTDYTFSAYVKTSWGNMNTLVLGHQDQSGTDIDDCVLTGTTINADWQRVSCSFSTGGTISNSNVYIKQTDSTNRTVDFDALMLQASPSLSAYNIGEVYFNAPINQNLIVTGNTYTNGNDLVFQVQSSGGDLQFGVNGAGAVTVQNDLAVNGGDITSTATTFNFLQSTVSTINIGGAVGAGGINFAGGSGSTGCTIDGSNGNLTCSGNISSTATSGTQGWWSRTGTTLQPTNSGDNITTSGNISTTGTGTITSAGNFIANGTAQFQNSSNSTTAFRIQNQAGTNLLTADTTNMRISIGSTGTPTGQLYVSGTSPTTNVGSVVAADGGSLVKVQGKYAYTLGYNDGVLHVIDITIPSSPTIVGSVTAPAGGSGLEVNGKYAYAIDFTEGLVVFDISDPSNPTVVTTVSVNAAGGSGSYDERLVISGRYLYMVDIGSIPTNFIIIDIANPSNPVVKSIDVPYYNGGSMLSAKVQGNYMYIGDYNTGQLLIYNMSDPLNPTQESSTSVSGALIDVFPVGRYLYAVRDIGTDAIIAYDVSDPANPTVVGSLNTGSFNPKGIHVQGRYAYVLFGSNRLGIYDISNPASITQVSLLNGGGLSIPYGFYVQGRYAYVSNSSNDTFVTYDLGGAYIQQLEVGGFTSTTLNTDSDANIGGSASVQGSLSVGGNTSLNGDLGVNGTARFQAQGNSATAFQIQSGTGDSLFTVDAYNYVINIDQSQVFVNGIAAPTGVTLSTNSSGGTLAAGTYYYRVFAYNAGGQFSNAAAPTPTSVTTTGATSRNTISWSAVPGAAGYYLLKSTDPVNNGWNFSANVGNVLTIDDTGSAPTFTGGAYDAFVSFNYSSAVGVTDGGLVSFAQDGNTFIAKDASDGTLKVYNAGGGVEVSGTVFGYRDTTSWDYPFVIDADGHATFKAMANGQYGFQVLNSTGGSLFTVDSTNNALWVGNLTPDSTGTALVLDNKNTSGDPTGTDGAMYYNSSSKSFRCYSNGTWRSCSSGVVFANTSLPGGNTVASTASETNFASNYSIPANDCQPGRVYKVTAQGVWSNGGGGTNTERFKVKLGSTTIGDTGTQAVSTGITDEAWRIEFNFICQTTGGSGTIEAQGALTGWSSIVNSANWAMKNTGTVTIDTTTSQTLQISVQHDSSSAGKTATLRQFFVEASGP